MVGGTGTADGVEPLDADDPTRLGDYQLLGRLGEGGMGTVYLGRRAAPGGAERPGAREKARRLVAVKVISGPLAREPEFRELFGREATAARRVARFCTAEVLDVDVTGPRPYLVTEYIDGPTLAAAVRRDGPLPSAEVERLAVAVAAALTAIHAAGLVHRDLKPSNIMLSSSGARVIDFGIARALDATTTSPGAGTPTFMAPEQAEGAAVGPPADVYAWGGVLVHAATGRFPHGTGPAPAVLYRVVHQEPDLTGLEPGLRALVARAMVKDPAARPSAQDLLLHLVGARRLDGLGTPAGEADVAEALTRAADLAAGAGAHRTAGPRDAGPTEATAVARTAVTGTRTRLPTVRVSAGLTRRSAPRETPVTPVGAALVGHGGRVDAVAFSPDGRLVASAGADGTARVWRVAEGGDGQPVGALPVGDPVPGTGPVGFVPAALAADSPLLAVASGRDVALYRVGDDGPHLLGPVATHSRDVTSLAFAADGTALAVGGGGLAGLWRVDQAGTRLTGREGEPLGAGDEVVAFAPTGTLLATTGGQGLRLWDAGGAAPRRLAAPTGFGGLARTEVAFAPGGSVLAVGGGFGEVRLLDIRDPGRPVPLAQVALRALQVTALAVSADGRVLAAAAGMSRAVQLFGVEDPAAPVPLGEVAPRPAGAARALAFAPRGGILATAGDALSLWRLVV